MYNYIIIIILHDITLFHNVVMILINIIICNHISLRVLVNSRKNVDKVYTYIQTAHYKLLDINISYSLILYKVIEIFF